LRRFRSGDRRWRGVREWTCANLHHPSRNARRRRPQTRPEATTGAGPLVVDRQDRGRCAVERRPWEGPDDHACGRGARRPRSARLAGWEPAWGSTSTSTRCARRCGPIAVCTSGGFIQRTSCAGDLCEHRAARFASLIGPAVGAYDRSPTGKQLLMKPLRAPPDARPQAGRWRSRLQAVRLAWKRAADWAREHDQHHGVVAQPSSAHELVRLELEQLWAMPSWTVPGTQQPPLP
jgi:hypothetical protein